MAKTRRQRARNGPDSQGGEKNSNSKSGNPNNTGNSNDSASNSNSKNAIVENSDLELSQGNSTITNGSIGSVLNANSGSCTGNFDASNFNLNQIKPTNNCPNADGVVVSNVNGTEPITRNPCTDNTAVISSVNGNEGANGAGSVHNDRVTLNSWLNMVAGPTVSKDCVVSSRTNMADTVKIDFDDIDEELVYWSSALVVYVLGANPPFSDLGEKRVRKGIASGKGLYIVRFKSVEECEQVWNDEPKFFDSKQVIMKRWDSEMELHKEMIKTGHRSLHKFGDAIGTTLKIDRLTEQKERLAFARILVEADIQKELPDQINFINEKGISMVQTIEYEWRPYLCPKCNKYGHREEECSKGVRKEMVWKPKPTNAPPSDQQQGCQKAINSGQQQAHFNQSIGQ
ncbi:Aspartate--ammonia ligase [Bienertia sinuspersici]